MAEEQKPAETTNADDKKEVDTKVEEKPTEEQSSEEDTATEVKDSKIDYEAEYKKEREAREKAEKAAAENRFKAAEKRRAEETTEVVENEEDKPLTTSEFEARLAQERQRIQKDLFATQANDIADRIAGSDAEKALILEIHRNRTFPPHYTIAEQLEEAYVIANKKKILGENSELKRALKGKAGVDKNAASAHHDPLVGTKPTETGVNAQEITRLGYSWSTTNRRYEKKLPKGDTLVIDPKTKRTRLISK